jgi:hypothetical protein
MLVLYYPLYYEACFCFLFKIIKKRDKGCKVFVVPLYSF